MLHKLFYFFLFLHKPTRHRNLEQIKIISSPIIWGIITKQKPFQKMCILFVLLCQKYDLKNSNKQTANPPNLSIMQNHSPRHFECPPLKQIAHSFPYYTANQSNPSAGSFCSGWNRCRGDQWWWRWVMTNDSSRPNTKVIMEDCRMEPPAITSVVSGLKGTWPSESKQQFHVRVKQC